MEDVQPRKGVRLGIGAAIIVLLGALSITVVIGIVRGAAVPVQEVTVLAQESVAASPTADPGMVVHVSGRVLTPGLYVLAAGARVMDAVAAAGGFAEDAQQDAINLARPVSDGEQLIVPAVGEEVPVVSSGSGSGSASGAGSGQVTAPVNLNTADGAELETLPRVGPAIAGKIIQWREENGRFTSVEDLLAVPGIGEKMLENLRELITV